jgi:hypothetical protein
MELPVSSAFAIEAIASDRPVFLTNFTCEPVEHVTLEELHALGLDTASDYPLTELESALIREEYLDIADGVSIATGYTALWRSKKWFMPEVQLFFPPRTNGVVTIPDAAAFVNAKMIGDALQARLKSVGVEVRVIECGNNGEDDHHTIQPLFPSSLVTGQFKTFDTWTAWLRATVIRAMEEAVTGVPEIVPGLPVPASFLLPPRDYSQTDARIADVTENVAEMPQWKRDLAATMA